MKSTGKNKKSAFRDIPYMGVVWVVAEAMKQGYYNGNPDWVNLGQGQPEIGEMEGAPPRINSFNIEPADQSYGPLGGMEQLREKVAEHYNRLFRADKKSKYTADNVSIAMGGRMALSRVFAALDQIRLGYKVPEYTAYEDLINYQKERVTPVEISTSAKNNFEIPAAEIEKVIRKNKLNAYVLSNPCNPTGHLLKGKDLKAYVDAASGANCTMIFDEFYSHFVYENNLPGKAPVSASEFVKDVNKDPVVIIDGLTKSFRYPGWRVGWIVGPKSVIDTLNRAASALDGGPSQPVLRSAIKVLNKEYADQETTALRNVFTRKRNYMRKVLTDAGIECLNTNGTFYLWGNLSKLPAPINKSERFFEEALRNKVMTVPGRFFHIQPGGKKKSKSDFDSWMRFSFGPTQQSLEEGVKRLTEMIDSFKTNQKATIKKIKKSARCLS